MNAETDFFRAPPPQATLILGGARSGKSALAEKLARNGGGALVYIATAEAHDGEMRERIARHRAERGSDWETIEAPLALPEALAAVAADRPEATVVIDCLTLWLSNLILADRDWAAAADRFCEQLSGLSARIICVSNEVGLGIVPDTPLGRVFRDAQGRLNQRVAAVADAVVFVAAGLPLMLKAPR